MNVQRFKLITYDFLPQRLSASLTQCVAFGPPHWATTILIIPSQIFFKLQEGISHHRLDHCSLRQCLALAVQKTPGDSAPPTERREKLF